MPGADFALLGRMTLCSLTEQALAQLRAALAPDVLRTAEPRYLEEPRGRWFGQAGVLALPRSVEDVSTIVRIAAEHRVPIVPYGGGTGLVGGQVVQDGPVPILISLERMAALRAVYPDENVIVVEAGMVLAQVQQEAEQAGRLFPLSLAAEGTAQIGGNLATNAGGTGVLRYGNARDLCLGLEAVLPDGRIWNGLSRLRKDNTGYDLRHLLIGSEGTLGIITAAALKLWARPAARGTAFFTVADPAAALSLLSLARDMLGEGMSAFELIHRQGFAFLQATLPDIRRPFEDAPEWCVLVELGLPAGQDAQAGLEHVFEAALERGLVSDGVIAQSAAQSDAFWAVRENIPEANRRIGAVSSHDISVPLGAIPDYIALAGAAIAEIGPFRINCFGHVGDGNLHYNVFPPEGAQRADFVDLRDQIKRTVHDLVHSLGGSVSAEHGVGRLKVDDLERYVDPVKLSAMRAIKTALDPAGIMNPGAVLRE